MRVILFGATGMVGQGVLRECLLDTEVTEILAVVRTPLDQRDPKLRELQHKNFYDFSGIDFSDFDACFFCLGVSSLGMSEAAYTRVTYDITVAAAAQMPETITFIYVSGGGTDSGVMWARVKKRTEDALLAKFPKAYMFRPGFIQPLHGIRPKSRVYALLLPLFWPLTPILQRFPSIASNTEVIGRAMLRVAREGFSKRVLESADIHVAG